MEKQKNLEPILEEELSAEEAEIVQLLEDSLPISLHCHHALVHNPFTWEK
ncbi:hypothetical protein [Bacillus sp. JJ1562]